MSIKRIAVNCVTESTPIAVASTITAAKVAGVGVIAAGTMFMGPIAIGCAAGVLANLIFKTAGAFILAGDEDEDGSYDYKAAAEEAVTYAKDMADSSAKKLAEISAGAKAETISLAAKAADVAIMNFVNSNAFQRALESTASHAAEAAVMNFAQSDTFHEELHNKLNQFLDAPRPVDEPQQTKQEETLEGFTDEELA